MSIKEKPRKCFTRDIIYGPIINNATGSNDNIFFRMFIIYLTTHYVPRLQVIYCLNFRQTAYKHYVVVARNYLKSKRVSSATNFMLGSGKASKILSPLTQTSYLNKYKTNIDTKI